MKRYFTEIESFNKDPRRNDDGWYFADQPFDATLKEMIGVPVQTQEDALSAVDWLIFQGQDGHIEFSDLPYGVVARSITNSLRNYLAEVRS